MSRIIGTYDHVRFPRGWERACRSGRSMRGNPMEFEWPSDIAMLDPDMQVLWHDTFTVAENYYGPKFAKYAVGTAWHAVMWRLQPVDPYPIVLPEPTIEMPVLSKLIEYVSVENAPQLTVVRFGPNVSVGTPDPSLPVVIHHVADEPDVLWEDNQKFMLAMPGFQLPRPKKARTNRAGAKVFTRFTQQEALKEHHLDDGRGLPAYELWPLGPAETFVYRSTKWTNKRDNVRGAQEYIHQFGPDVTVYMAPGEEAFFFQGGLLDMVEGGIIN